MRERWKPWVKSQSRDVAGDELQGRRDFVTRHSFAPILLATLPPGVLMALVWVPLGILALGVASFAFLFVMAAYFLSFIGGRRLMASAWWQWWKSHLVRLCQVETPSLWAGEEIIATSFLNVKARISNDGRFTVTNRRVLFQRPRWRFLPPRESGPIWQVSLVGIAKADSETPSLLTSLLRNRQPHPVLRIEAWDGTRMEFFSTAADGWSSLINEAKQDSRI